MIVRLLAQGFYRADVAPDPLEEVLRADPRFMAAGLRAWMLAEKVTPDVRAAIHRRQQLEAELFQTTAEPTPDLERAPSPRALRASMERTVGDVSTLLGERAFASIEEANAFRQELLSQGVCQVGRNDPA